MVVGERGDAQVEDINDFGISLVMDGQENGIELAIDALKSIKPEVDQENQTWDSAIAVLEMLLANAKRQRP